MLDYAAGLNHGAAFAQSHHGLRAAPLVEHALRRREGDLTCTGALAVRTGQFTGRSPRDKYIVATPASKTAVWWGEVNHPLSEAAFDRLLNRTEEYLRRRDVYVQELYAGASPDFRLPVRVVTELAWQSLFARQLLLRPEEIEGGPAPAAHPGLAPLAGGGVTMLCAPGCRAVPDQDGTRSETFIALHLERGLVLIGGTEYGGEIKKSVFTLMNYLLPQAGVLPMHCSANVGRRDGGTALFFGLSGTGKTTLSTDPERELVGDDEHGWADECVFNIEGGCYAKCIGLSEDAEPDIYRAVRFGAVVENVVLDEDTRIPDYGSAAYTENTRAAYPIQHIPGAVQCGICAPPQCIFLLTADAFGVLPPISRLTVDQACYYYLSGYTAKVAGTERGLAQEPQATFSACFGQPFLPLPPELYAGMLADRLRAHRVQTWLVNTGWTGGGYGTGERMALAHTRALVRAALAGELDTASFARDPIFGLEYPTEAPQVPPRVLNPRSAWPETKGYDAAADRLAGLFRENFARFSGSAAGAVQAAGPPAGK